MKTAGAIWEKSRLALVQSMTDVSYNTWVEPLSPVSVTEEELILQVSDEVAQKTLQSVFNDVIQKCVNDSNGTDLNLHFILPDERRLYVTEEEEIDRDRNFLLNPRYTFDNFVIGSSNNFAHAAAKAVADSPSSAYNPLFIYGGVGLGKTHLMHAVGNRITSLHKNMNIVYVTSETFTYELIEAIGANSMTQFRNKYRKADILMVDDIQFIAGKKQTQEEFFNTFEALHTAGKQIILNSDRPPMELSTLEERLRSRFEGGLIADIQPPDLEMRIAILKMKANQENTQVGEDVLMFIAEKVKSNIRQLEGCFNRVLAFSSFTQKPIDIEMADSVLKGIVPGYSQKPLTIEDIQKAVAEYYNVDISAMLSQRRTMEITYPRQVAMYLCKKMMDVSLKYIGKSFGNRDHTTVMNACTKIEKELKENKKLSSALADLETRIRNEQN